MPAPVVVGENCARSHGGSGAACRGRPDSPQVSASSGSQNGTSGASAAARASVMFATCSRTSLASAAPVAISSTSSRSPGVDADAARLMPGGRPGQCRRSAHPGSPRWRGRRRRPALERSWRRGYTAGLNAFVIGLRRGCHSARAPFVQAHSRSRVFALHRHARAFDEGGYVGGTIPDVAAKLYERDGAARSSFFSLIPR